MWISDVVGCETGRGIAPGSRRLPSGAGDHGELHSAARRAPRRQEPSLLASYSSGGAMSKRYRSSFLDSGVSMRDERQRDAD